MPISEGIVGAEVVRCLSQDLAVVVLLMLIPLLAPAENGAQAAGFSKIARALGVAAVKVPLLFTFHPLMLYLLFQGVS